MSFFSLFRRKKLPPTPPSAPPPEVAFEGYAKLVREIEEVLPGEGADLFRRVARRFAASVYDLPASESHHHAEKFGLLRHSLETALEATRAADGSLNQEHLDSGETDTTKTERTRRHYMEALVGLLHDAGKVFDVDVKVGYEEWNPGYEGLYDFLQRLKATDYEMTWLPDRFHRHVHRNVIVARRVVFDDDLAFLGQELFLEFVARLVSLEVSPADVVSVKADLDAAEPAPAMPKDRAFLESVRELVKLGDLKLNRPRGNIFIGDECTFLVSPEPLQKVIEHMRMAKGVYTSRQENLVEHLHAAGLLREKDGRNFFKVELMSPGMPPVVLGGLFIRNNRIWVEGIPGLFAGSIKVPVDPGFRFRGRDEE